jgi:membrane-associated phospholipid phosphatase
MLLVRIRALAPWKALGAGCYLLGLGLYAAVQAAGQGRSFVVPWSAWDVDMPVLPWLLPVYVLQLVLVGIPFLFIEDFPQWRRSVIGLASLSAVVMSVQLLWPTTVVRPTSDSAALALLRRFDGSGNAMPSLHAACAVYVAVLMQGLRGVGRWTLIATWAWVLLVMIACVSLRQHTLLDLVTGGFLGGIAAALAGVWRPSGAA